MRKLSLLAVIGLAIVLTAATVKADPWPSLNASAGTLSFVTVTATQGPANIWSFALSVDASAPIGGAINVGGIKALAVYLNNSDAGPAYTGVTTGKRFRATLPGTAGTALLHPRRFLSQLLCYCSVPDFWVRLGLPRCAEKRK